jgi:hypothetical protein
VTGEVLTLCSLSAAVRRGSFPPVSGAAPSGAAPLLSGRLVVNLVVWTMPVRTTIGTLKPPPRRPVLAASPAQPQHRCNQARFLGLRGGHPGECRLQGHRRPNSPVSTAHPGALPDFAGTPARRRGSR